MPRLHVMSYLSLVISYSALPFVTCAPQPEVHTHGSQAERTRRAVRFQLLWQALNAKSVKCIEWLIGAVANDLSGGSHKYSAKHAKDKVEVSLSCALATIL